MQENVVGVKWADMRKWFDNFDIILMLTDVRLFDWKLHANSSFLTVVNEFISNIPISLNSAECLENIVWGTKFTEITAYKIFKQIC